jgi:hypothetical protein
MVALELTPTQEIKDLTPQRALPAAMGSLPVLHQGPYFREHITVGMRVGFRSMCWEATAMAEGGTLPPQAPKETVEVEVEVEATMVVAVALQGSRGAVVQAAVDTAMGSHKS